MYSPNLTIPPKDKCSDFDAFGLVAIILFFSLFAEFMVVLIKVTEPKEKRDDILNINLSRTIFCMTVINLALVCILVSMEKFKVVVQCFKDTWESQTVRRIYYLTLLLASVVLCSVCVSLWIWQF